MRANPNTFAAYQALGRALARLAPFYRREAVAAAAKALAAGKPVSIRELRRIMGEEEFARACIEAVGILQSRNAAAFDLAIRRCKGAIISFARRCRSVWRVKTKRPSTNT